MTNQFIVLLRYFSLQSVSLIDGIDAKVMVEVSVGAEQVHWLQSLAVDVVGDSFALLIVVSTAVDDNTLLRLVAHYIGILLQQIHLKSLNLKHCFLWLGVSD